MQHLPNIVLLVMDTTAAKHLSLYGYHKKTTPCLERLSEEAVVYTRCFSPAQWTIPSHASLFTGLYPGEHRFTNTFSSFDNRFYCLAEIMKSAGYQTFGVSSNGIVSKANNFHKGFDRFFEMCRLVNSNDFFTLNQAFNKKKKQIQGELQRFLFLLRYALAARRPHFLYEKFANRMYEKLRGNKVILKKSEHATLRTLKLAKRLLTGSQGKPFFLFLNFMETHTKYNPPPKYDRFVNVSESLRRETLAKTEFDHYAFAPFPQETFEVLNKLYDGEILFLDSVIHNLYLYLKEHRILDNTLLIITSDHGELIGEHNHCGHTFSLYNELIHVPLIIRFPREYQLKGEENKLVQLHDLFATILEVIDSPYPVPRSSRSVLSAKRDFAVSQIVDVSIQLQACKRRNASLQVQSFMQPQFSLITREMLKLIKRVDGTFEFYDLSHDFWETENLAHDPSYTERRKQVEQLLPPLEILTGFTEIAQTPDELAPEPREVFF
jgi:arylsulfatase A-like enzyme